MKITKEVMEDDRGSLFLLLVASSNFVSKLNIFLGYWSLNFVCTVKCQYDKESLNLFV